MSWEQDPWMNPEFRMARGSRQRDWRAGRKRVLTILGITLGVYAIYLLVGGEFGLWRLHALQDRERQLSGEIVLAQERVDLLRRDLADIDGTIERVAREKFEYARPNELVYEVPPADSGLVPGSVIGPGGLVSPGKNDPDTLTRSSPAGKSHTLLRGGAVR